MPCTVPAGVDVENDVSTLLQNGFSDAELTEPHGNCSACGLPIVEKYFMGIASVPYHVNCVR